MKAKIRYLEKTDIGDVFAGWRAAFPLDDIPLERFEHRTLNDRNYAAAGHLVAIENQRIVGFVSAIARCGVAGQDGMGTAAEKEYGYIKGLYVLKECTESLTLKRKLLELALAFIRSEAKTAVKVGQYTGYFFNPGIDVRYTGERQFYQANGFKEIDLEEDVSIDLTNFTPSPYHLATQQRIKQIGVVIHPYQSGLLSKMKQFVQRLQIPNFFPPNWEKGFDNWGTHLVALKDGDVVGWAMYNPVFYEGFFGPIAILQNLRRKGIGTALLLESMLQMKAEGTSSVTAGWANVPFYLKSGWIVSRRYTILEKQLV
jgi:ribosomal protein S18 acetylase RimI-like enzyme